MTEDTHEIESILSRYRPAGPDAGLRMRIVQQSRRRSIWPFMEAIAAVVLIGLNLAQIGASVTRLVPQAPADEARDRTVAAAIGRLDLPVTVGEARVLAMELVAGEHLVPLPLIHGRTAFGTTTEQYHDLRPSLD
jgi:hypothetical protein